MRFGTRGRWACVLLLAMAACNAAPSPALDLEALIPGQISGITMRTFSVAGAELVDGGSGDPILDRFLADLGNIDEVNVAYAVGVGDTFQRGTSMIVVRAAGHQGGDMIDAYKRASGEERTEPLAWEPGSVSGKAFESAIDDLQESRIVYLYGFDDVLIILGVTHRPAAEEVIAGLP